MQVLVLRVLGFRVGFAVQEFTVQGPGSRVRVQGNGILVQVL